MEENKISNRRSFQLTEEYLHDLFQNESLLLLQR